MATKGIGRVWRVAAASGLLAAALFVVGASGRSPAAHAGVQNECYFNDFRASVAGEPNEPCLITLTKDLTSGSTARVGDTVTFRIVVSNDGWLPLDGMVVVDTFDSADLQFTSADPAPTSTDDGLLYWEDLPDPDDDEDNVWEYGDSQTITVRFRARDESAGTENCAVAGGVVAQEVQPESFSASQELLFDVSSDEDCARLTIEERRTRRNPTSTPTARPNTPVSTPSPVVSVLPATAVPPTPRAGVTLPDTGTGPGDGGSNAGLVILAAVGSAIIAGAALRFRKSR